MLRTAARIFGIAFILVGILGFVPGVTKGHMLLGVFHVNAAHNIVHLLSGAAALAAAASGAAAARTYFRIFGLVYGLVAILGFLGGDKPVMGMISNNRADAWLHVAIALTSLVLGFAVKPEPQEPRPIGPAHPTV